MLKIAIFEEIDEYGNELQLLFEQYLRARNLEGRVLLFDRKEDYIGEMTGQGFSDIYVLGVKYPDETGLELGRTIREADKEGVIILLADSADKALEGYRMWAFQYFVRPFDTEELLFAVDRAMSLLQKRVFAGVSVKTRNGTVRLLLDEILYAELRDRTVRYVCKTRVEESLSLTGAFRSAVAPLLDDNRFRMCGASFAVNLYYVRLVDRDGAELITGERLQLPKTACAPLLAEWTAYWEKGELMTPLKFKTDDGGTNDNFSER